MDHHTPAVAIIIMELEGSSSPDELIDQTASLSHGATSSAPDTDQAAMSSVRDCIQRGDKSNLAQMILASSSGKIFCI